MKFLMYSHPDVFHICYVYTDEKNVKYRNALAYIERDGFPGDKITANYTTIKFKNIRHGKLYFPYTTTTTWYSIRKNIFKDIFNHTVCTIFLAKLKQNIKL